MLQAVADYSALCGLRGLTNLFQLLPRKIGRHSLHLLAKIITTLQPKHLNVGRKNLEIAFPEKSAEEREEILRDHLYELSGFVLDSFCLTTFDEKWAETHISFPNRALFTKLKEQSETGILIATGHLGSFELLAHVAALFGSPLSFVVRNFPLQRLDRWWCSQRELKGNKVINRKGAYKDILENIKSGRDVGILFDQNVTFNHATFVPWFGLDAATTKALGLAAFQTETPIIVSALCHKEDGHYELLMEECDVKDIHEKEELSRDEKIKLITERATNIFTSMIKRYPSQWFWLHRRWKTRPDDGPHPY